MNRQRDDVVDFFGLNGESCVKEDVETSGVLQALDFLAPRSSGFGKLRVCPSPHPSAMCLMKGTDRHDWVTRIVELNRAVAQLVLPMLGFRDHRPECALLVAQLAMAIGDELHELVIGHRTIDRLASTDWACARVVHSYNAFLTGSQ